MGYRPELDRTEAVELVINSLFQAADEDSATGGPDLVRGIYPVIATITAAGFARVDDDEIAERFRVLLDRLSAAEGTSAAVTGTTGEGSSDR
jgi:proteasome beta subunit